jgi:preprotein translocase subunit SecE
MADKEIKDTELEELNSEEITEVVEDSSVEASDKTEGKKSGKKEKAVAKKRNIFVRFGSLLKRFWKTMRSEMKKVTWFSRKQTYTSTLLVLVVMVVAGVVIGLLDFGVSTGFEALANSVNLLGK